MEKYPLYQLLCGPLRNVLKMRDFKRLHGTYRGMVLYSVYSMRIESKLWYNQLMY